MRKRLKIVGLIIFGCIILIVSFLCIRYVIHSDGDKYNVDADYVSIIKVEDGYEESREMINEPIDKESLAETFELFITEEDIPSSTVTETAVELETQYDEVVDEKANEVIDEQVNEVVSEECVEETVLYEEPNEESSEEERVTDEDSLDEEIVTYTGDAYIDTTIHEHRDEIADEDIVFGLSIADRIDINMVYSYMEEGLTDEEREVLSQYLHSLLTEAEYAKLKELFYKYNYILE